MLEDQFGGLLDVKTLSDSRGSKELRRPFKPPLSPAELAKKRAGEEYFVGTRREDAEKGIATMVRVRAELAAEISEVPSGATHRVLNGEFAGAYCFVLSFCTVRGAFVRAQILSDKQNGIIFLKPDQLVKVDTGGIDENLQNGLDDALARKLARRKK